ncbi:glycosyltransferase [Marinilactibacillus kalidii]|uniref:glycosyltransferase n=1 Tax=Marinilactibacillus kalidii TaxID=2820274 RepID=UPI001ABE9F8D|nr:glycosyltransferase family 2 protein [Marinilactibacillus kalidii]
MQIALILSVILIALALLSGFFLLWNLPYIPKAKKQQHVYPELSVIIPVRNEEKNIPHLLDSLKKQTLQPKEIIVVDDDSTDRTVEILSHYPVKIKHRDNNVDDTTLVGKTVACYRGAKEATGDWLIFIDADTTFDHENSLLAICEAYRKVEGKGLFTIQPYHRTKKLYEHLSAPLNMIVVAGINAFTPFKERYEVGGAFGPFLMCSTKDYEKTGGHEKTLDSHMDNIAMTKLFQSNGLPIFNFGGKGVLSLRMYPEGPKQWLQGWSKSVANGSSNTHPSVMAAVSLWIAGGFIALFILLLTSLSQWWIGLIISLVTYFAYASQFAWLSRKVGKFPLWLFIIYPILLVAFVIVFTWSFIQVHVLHSVSWRDRKIDV